MLHTRIQQITKKPHHTSSTVWTDVKTKHYGTDDKYYCKARFFRVPFISRISQACQIRENNGPRKFEYSSFNVIGSKNAKITGSKIITLTQMPKLRVLQ